MNLTSPPAVLSVSWGNGESNFDVQHMHAANIEFAKMGLKGHTVLTASGDDGTGGQGGLFSPCKRFDPTWPTSSPYVTSVGGTYLDSTNGGTEIGWSFSGGGFSAVFERPSYQNEAVGAYVKDATLPPASLFNASGRATPDVSALSTNFKTLAKGAYGCLSGTSAATPVFVHSGRVHWIFMQRLSRGLGRRQLVHRAERVEVPRDGRVSSKSAPQSGHLTVHKAVLAFLRHREHTTSSTGWARRIAMPVHPGIVQEYARSGIEAA